MDPADGSNQIINRRIAAMLLSARGDIAAASELLRGVPDLPVGTAIQTVGILLTIPTRGMRLEEHAMKAFGLSPDDPIVLEALLHGLMTLGYYETAERIAMRLLAVQPNQREALDAIRVIRDKSVVRDQATSSIGVPDAASAK